MRFRSRLSKLYPLLLAAVLLLCFLSHAEGEDLSLGPWEELNSLSRNRFIHGCVALKGYLYVIGGHSGGQSVDTVYYAKILDDGTIEKWNETASLPHPLSYHAVAAAGDHIYVVSGSSKGGDLQNAVYVAEVKPDGGIAGWQPASPLPDDCRGSGAAVVCKGGVYYIGGFYRRQAYRADILADGRLGQWKEVQHLLSARMNAGAAQHGETLYLIGGAKSVHANMADVYRANLTPDGALDGWERTTPLPEENSAFSTVVVDDTIFVMGGGHRRDVYAATVLADGGLSAWREEAPLPEEVSLAGAAYYKGMVYHVGGWRLLDDGKKTVSNSVYAARVHRELRYPVRIRSSENIVQSLGWLRLRTVYVQKGAEAVSIEAENSTRIALGSSSMTPVEDEGASGGRCIRHVSELENRIVIQHAGDYQAWYRAFFPFKGSWNHWERMDEEDAVMVRDSQFGTDKEWLWVRGPVYKLAEGEHRYLWPAPTAWRGGALLDKILLRAQDEKEPEGKGPPASTGATAHEGRLVSNRFRLDEMYAWELSYEKEENGGTIEMEYSLDRGKTWRILPGAGKLAVDPVRKRLTFRLRFVAGPDGISPAIRNLTLVGLCRYD
jgi:hypothetical protein